MSNSKSNLVVVSAGNSSLHETFYKHSSSTREFDLFVVYFGDDDAIADTYRTNSSYFLKLKTNSPRHALYHLINTHRIILDKYDYVWVTDDDISADEQTINTLFKIATEKELLICQPSISGHPSWESHRKQDGVLLRYVAYVDQQCPVISISLLDLISYTLNPMFSDGGWGIEYLWSWDMGKPENKIAIIDIAEVVHTKPSCSDYSRFKIHPRDEMMTKLYPHYREAMDWATNSFTRVDPIEYSRLV